MTQMSHPTEHEVTRDYTKPKWDDTRQKFRNEIFEQKNHDTDFNLEFGKF